MSRLKDESAIAHPSPSWPHPTTSHRRGHTDMRAERPERDETSVSRLIAPEESTRLRLWLPETLAGLSLVGVMHAPMSDPLMRTPQFPSGVERATDGVADG